MRIALGQINTTVGDLGGNVDRMLRQAREAALRDAHVIVFPELSVNGYPPRDFVEKDSFLERTQCELERLTAESASLDISIVCGYVGRAESQTGKKATNSAALIERGSIVFRQHKMLLPTYDVFDEARWFVPATEQSLADVRGRRAAVTICEDAWNDKQLWDRRLYLRDPVEELAQSGAQVLLSINASPYHIGKRKLRRELFARAAQRYNIPVVYVNQVGGNDQLVFDGSSFAMDSTGRVIASAASFQEDLVLVDVDTGAGEHNDTLRDECEAVYDA